MSYILKISSDHNDRRLDRTLRSVWKWVTLGEIMKAIRKGEVRVNSARIREPGTHVFTGDELSVPWPLNAKEQKIKTASWGRIKIIFQGKNVMIVNKPAGILVQPDLPGGDSIITRVWGVLGSRSPAAVHRLDRNTTGVLAIALHGDALRILEKLFKDRMIRKTYLAIVAGYVPDFLEIDAPLLKDAENNLVKVSYTDGLKALTRCTRIAGDSQFSLVSIELLTGRTHQARVHMAHVKHPIIGDRKYGTFRDDNNKKVSRPLLHAFELGFPSDLPEPAIEVSGKVFRAPVPSDMRDFILARGWKEVV